MQRGGVRGGQLVPASVERNEECFHLKDDKGSRLKQILFFNTIMDFWIVITMLSLLTDKPKPHLKRKFVLEVLPFSLFGSLWEIIPCLSNQYMRYTVVSRNFSSNQNWTKLYFQYHNLIVKSHKRKCVAIATLTANGWGKSRERSSMLWPTMVVCKMGCGWDLRSPCL